MKIPDYKVGTSFEITCTKIWHEDLNQWYYRDFEIHKNYASIYGRKSEDVITVKMTIIENDVCIKDIIKNKNYNENCIDYYGRIHFEKEGLRIGCIYGNIKLYTVCFPYGPDEYDQLYWHKDVNILGTNEILHHKGDRKAMNVRLKIDEI